MKKSRILAAAVAALCSQTALLGGCAGAPENIVGATFDAPEHKSIVTYDNGDFGDYSAHGEIKSELLPDQWPEYGAGDPYIFRYNGAYYLYVSTRDGMVGVRGWKSSDLVHWQKCTGAGLADGYVSEDPVTLSAYAPEVFGFNGKFYMFTSPAGKGHYTLRADSPEGPFEVISGNYGMNIDASVFMDDDETIYFLNAANGGIEIRQMDSFESTPGRAVKLESTSMGWTEGPMLIKRDGRYYLTYTGTQVTSPGYRVCYATARDGDKLARRDAFTDGAGNPVLLNVDEENNFKGLGHSSTVLGPDMDSRYMAYHSLNSTTGHGPWRSLNIDRLLFNGSQMSVSASKTNSIAPRMPIFAAENAEGDGFEATGDKRLTVRATGDVFTAEYNFTGDNVKCIAGYTDADNYVYAVVDYAGKSVALHAVIDGNDRRVAAGTLKNAFDKDVLHTVRIAYADGKCDVYFDDMRKISDADITVGAGRIGYDGGTARYTAFSDVARGYSDRMEYKQADAAIGASAYLPDGAFDGVDSYRLGDGSGISTVEADTDEYPDDAAYDGARMLTLANDGDFARYSAYFRKGGHYGLTLTYDKKYAGRNIGVQINGGAAHTVTLPEVNASEDDFLCNIVSANVAEFDAEAGANIITLIGGKNEVGFISFTMTERAYGEFGLVSDLKETVDRGALYSSMFRLTDEGHMTRSGNRMLVFFGDGTISDCEMEVSMRFVSENIYGAGVILRASNYATSNFDDNTSMQCYYVGIKNSLVSLSKYNYTLTRTNVRYESHGHRDSLTEHWFKIKTTFKGNTVAVSVDGKEVFRYTDPHPFPAGYFGLYSEGAEVVYKNLTIKGF